MVDAKLILLETPGWTWSLFPNQSYLGRVQLTLRRQCDGSLAKLTDDEWTDLRRCFQAYERLLSTLFQPDRFNYEQLGNVWTQVHVHAIPRYSGAREWQGITIQDSRWGNHPLPEPPSPLGEAETLQLAKKMCKELQSAGI
jgi:diadenosine tetraphosphate (Ap4A) HIT family hydrolase